MRTILQRILAFLQTATPLEIVDKRLPTKVLLMSLNIKILRKYNSEAEQLMAYCEIFQEAKVKLDERGPYDLSSLYLLCETDTKWQLHPRILRSYSWIDNPRDVPVDLLVLWQLKREGLYEHCQYDLCVN